MGFLLQSLTGKKQRKVIGYQISEKKPNYCSIVIIPFLALFCLEIMQNTPVFTKGKTNNEQNFQEVPLWRMLVKNYNTFHLRQNFRLPINYHCKLAS